MRPIVTIESFLKKKGSLSLLSDVDLLEATQPINDINGTCVRVCVIVHFVYFSVMFIYLLCFVLFCFVLFYFILFCYLIAVRTSDKKKN